MKLRWIIATTAAFGLYVGTTGGNALRHLEDYNESKRIAQSSMYPVELRKACLEYTERQHELLTSFRILNPFVSAGQKPYEPVFQLKQTKIKESQLERS